VSKKWQNPGRETSFSLPQNPPANTTTVIVPKLIKIINAAIIKTCPKGEEIFATFISFRSFFLFFVEVMGQTLAKIFCKMRNYDHFLKKCNFS